jgi:Fe2+ or Zn2+ uptake regulation protein
LSGEWTIGLDLSTLGPVAAEPDPFKSLTQSRTFARLSDMSAEVDQLLRLHGVQVTAQRLAIMRAVSSRPHATADELTDEVRAVIGSISRQAVYDTLGVLVDKNLVRRIQPAGSAARYENRVGDNHHHLICRDCGATFDIDCAVGAVPCLTADDDHGFEIDEAEVIYWGYCPDCVGPRATPTPSNDKIPPPKENRRV